VRAAGRAATIQHGETDNLVLHILQHKSDDVFMSHHHIWRLFYWSIKWGLIMTIHIDEYIVGHRNIIIIIIAISYLHSTNNRSTLFCANILPSPNFSTFVFTHTPKTLVLVREPPPRIYGVSSFRLSAALNCTEIYQPFRSPEFRLKVIASMAPVLLTRNRSIKVFCWFTCGALTG
jgi:hypothetical protein